MRALTMLLVIVGIAVGCKKDHSTAMDIWRCSNLVFEDSSTLQTKIIGSWNLMAKRCPQIGRNFQNMQGVKLTLLPNGSYTLEEYDRVADNGQWKLTQVDNGNWGLQLSIPNQYMHGKLVVCNNRLMFFDSYRDGCDHVFETK
jgi:hypothetical protein